MRGRGCGFGEGGEGSFLSRDDYYLMPVTEATCEKNMELI